MPKTDAQLKELKEVRRKEIVIAGLKVFCEKGYDGTTVSDITKKANCSHGLFYHYFKTKKDIYDEVLKTRNDVMSDELHIKVGEQKLFVDKLRVITEYLFNNIREDENCVYNFYFFVSQRFSHKDKTDRPKPPHDRKPPWLIIEKLFEDGQNCGEFTKKYSAKDLANIWFSVIQGATLNYVLAPKEVQSKIKMPSVDIILDLVALRR